MGMHVDLVLDRGDGLMEERIHFSRFGLLFDLRREALRLSDRYPWHLADAATFLVTGWVPILSRIRIESSRDGQIPTLSRITMTIDPDCSGEEVRRTYSKARREIMGGRLPGPKKPERAARLLEFMTGRDQRRPTLNMGAWNRAYPQDGFKHRGDFKRAVDRAVDLLLAPKYPDWFNLGLAGDDSWSTCVARLKDAWLGLSKEQSENVDAVRHTQVESPSDEG